MDGKQFYNDKIRALEAKFEAQKIAFSPLSFQAVRALRDLGLLQAVSDAGEAGVSAETLAKQARVSLYGVRVLAEMALGLGVFKLKEGGGELFTLGKIGWFLLEDAMTIANFDFTNDVCYQGAFALTDSIRSGRPEGLKVFGGWKTIYEGLASLPQHVRKSWFAFDHFYSDIAFPEALPVVFERKPANLYDIGGNTAKWAISCCRYDSDVKVTIVDLPGQTAEAEKNAAAAGFANRIGTAAANMLDSAAVLPPGADAVWMSQFLDCFSLEEVTRIAAKVCAAAGPETDVWVLEPLWDQQHFDASAFSLQATSLYFTCMANGNSKMYRFAELNAAVEAGGFELKTAHHNLGSNSYSLLRYRKAK